MGARKRDGTVKFGIHCGCDIVVEGRRSGCKDGKRQYRTQVTSVPEILEVFWVGIDAGTIRALHRIEHSIVVHDQHYKFVDVMLYNGSHYRSLCFLFGKYLEYDGMRTPMLKWLSETDVFENGWQL